MATMDVLLVEDDPRIARVVERALTDVGHRVEVARDGLEGLTKVAALDYAAAGVRVNAIAPGPILTDNLKRAGPGAQQAAAAAMPMRRIGQPNEVAAAVVWLCSDDAAFVTGTTLVIDGGKLAGSPPFVRERKAR